MFFFFTVLLPHTLTHTFTSNRPNFGASIGTEELAHLEVVGSIVHQLTRDLSIDEIKKGGYDAFFVDHTLGVWPSNPTGVPFTSAYFQSKGDPITDLMEDMAAEQKARTTYDNILRLVDDPDRRT